MSCGAQVVVCLPGVAGHDIAWDKGGMPMPLFQEMLLSGRLFPNCTYSCQRGGRFAGSDHRKRDLAEMQIRRGVSHTLACDEIASIPFGALLQASFVPAECVWHTSCVQRHYQEALLVFWVGQPAASLS